MYSMKKIVLTLAILISGIGYAFAGEAEVDARVLDAFRKDFNSASDITWTQAAHYYQASFLYHEQYVTAYYTTEGELMGLTRNISPVDLPLALQGDLKKNHSGYWISGLFEAATDKGTTYYITLEDADSSVVLRSSNARSWDTYKKVKKA